VLQLVSTKDMVPIRSERKNLPQWHMAGTRIGQA